MKEFIKEIKYPLVLIIFGLLVFGVVAAYGHISIDDPSYVFNNPSIAPVTFHNFVKLLFQPYANMVRPVDSLVYFIEYRLWGMHPAGYHITNLLFHITDSILVFVAAGFFMEKKVYRFLAALIFLLHPVQIETAAWISEQKSTLSTLFLLAAFISYMKYRIQGWNRGRHISFAFFLLGILTKPNIVIFPVLLVWYDFVFSKETLWKNIIGKYYFWVLSLITGLIYLFFVHKTGFVTTLFGGTLSSHVLTTISNVAGVAQYPIALVFPFYIHMIAYPDHPIVHMISPQFLVSVLFLIIVLYAGYYAYKHRQRTVLFFIGWYYVNFLLASGLIPMAYQGAVRYLYVPLIGPAVLFALGIQWLQNHAVAVFSRKEAGISLTIASVSLVLCSFVAIDLVSVRAWKNELSFWNYQVWTQPDNARDRAYLADALVSRHAIGEAVSEAQKAVALSPDDPAVWSKVAGAYFRAGLYEELIKTLGGLQRSLIKNYGNVNPVRVPDSGAGYEIRTYYFYLYTFYADAYFKTSDYGHSLAYTQKALALQPDNEHLFAIETDILLTRHKPGDVLSLSQDFINRKPDSPTPYLMRALAYEQMDQLNDALVSMDKAIALCKDTARREFMMRKRQEMYNLLKGN